MSELIGSKEEAKNTMTNAVFGLLLALGAYAILNTINPDILSLRFIGGGDAEQQEQNGGTPPEPTPPEPEPEQNQNTPGQINESCEFQQITCSNNNCGQYLNAITTVANGDQEMLKILKAIMLVESSCNINAGSDAGACGLFQIIPNTGNNHKNGCTTDNITCSWLKNPNNMQASACIAKNYLIDLKSAQNAGGQWRNAFAAYNGGEAGALGISQDCQNDVSCLNGNNVLRWECPWDNPEHTTPNTGYNESRNYVKKVSYCVENPGF